MVGEEERQVVRESPGGWGWLTAAAAGPTCVCEGEHGGVDAGAARPAVGLEDLFF
jgi:hypothetical protein